MDKQTACTPKPVPAFEVLITDLNSRIIRLDEVKNQINHAVSRINGSDSSLPQPISEKKEGGGGIVQRLENLLYDLNEKINELADMAQMLDNQV